MYTHTICTPNIHLTHLETPYKHHIYTLNTPLQYTKGRCVAVFPAVPVPALCDYGGKTTKVVPSQKPL